MNVKVFNLMSRVNKTRFVVQHVDWTKLYVIQMKNGIMMNVGASELDDWSSCRDDYMWNPGTCNWECNKVCKIDEY